MYTHNGKHDKNGKGKGKRVLVESGKDAMNWSILSGTRPSTTIPLSCQNKPYSVVQSQNAGTIVTTSTTVPTFGVLYFTIGGLDQVSTFGALFDQYKINQVEVWVLPLVTTTVNASYATVLDFDDGNNLTTYAQALDYTNVQETMISQGQRRKFIPHVAVATYNGSFAGYANEKSPWLDMSSTSIQHYGLKIAAQQSSAAITINVTYRLHCSFRNLR